MRSPETFAAMLRDHGMDLPVEERMTALGKPLEVEGKTIPSRICFQPLEGYDSRSDGSPSELVYRRYRRFARSGAGLIWFDFAGFGRQALAYPEFARTALDGKIPESDKCCILCNGSN